MPEAESGDVVERESCRAGHPHGARGVIPESLAELPAATVVLADEEGTGVEVGVDEAGLVWTAGLDGPDASQAGGGVGVFDEGAVGMSNSKWM